MASGNREEGGAHFPALISAYNATQIVGLTLVLLMLLPVILSPSVRRSVAWINFIVSWIYSCVVFMLIIGHQYGPEPPFGLCLAQAVGIYSAPAMNAAACLAFATELLLKVRSSLSGHPGRGKLLVAVFPYVFPFLICIEVLVLGLGDRSGVKRNTTSMYCHLESPWPARVSGTIVVLFGIMIWPIVGVTSLLFYRHWHAFQEMGAGRRVEPLSMVVRFSLFCLLPIPALVMALCMLVIDRFGNPMNAGILNVFIGTLPILAALLFGTQRDILRAWVPWKNTDASLPLVASESKRLSNLRVIDARKTNIDRIDKSAVLV